MKIAALTAKLISGHGDVETARELERLRKIRQEIFYVRYPTQMSGARLN